MLITRIELENIKSYRQVSVDFRRGTTAISGANGAGKTTLVEAIGYALFGYLPYNQEQFVREGEKGGKVVIHLIGSDDRPYTVERRCGSGARWLVFDEEADMRLEQRADVQDKLHEIFGIDRERALDALFRDALGVPQGTFTSIFLDTASKRKQTFDALLQIEDYKTAADHLLETQRYYKEQGQAQQQTITRLEYETRQLQTWREELKVGRLLDQEQKRQSIHLSERLTTQEAHKEILDQQAEQVKSLRVQYDQAQSQHTYAQSLLQDKTRSFQLAQAAQRIVLESQADFEQNQQATLALRQLRQEANTRDALRQQQSSTTNTQMQISERIKNHQSHLAEVEMARRRIADLAPKVEQQIELEQQHEEARQQTLRYEDVRKAGKRLLEQLNSLREEQVKTQRSIATIEPLIPQAQLLDARTEAQTQLRMQANTRLEKQHQLKAKQAILSEKQAEHEPLKEKLRRAENNLKIIEERRSEVAELPQLEETIKELAIQKGRLEGNIDGYARSRAQSAGGQCPLLNESCLNIQQRGIASLESYFENLLTEEKAKIAVINQQLQTRQERKNQVKKLADALGNEALFIERRDNRDRDMQYLEREIAQAEQEIAILTQELAVVEQVEQQLQQADRELLESRQADRQVRDLAGLRRQAEQLQTQMQQAEAEIQTLRQEATQLQESASRLKQIVQELAALSDPRAESRAKQETVGREASYLQQLNHEQQQLAAVQQRLTALDEQLAHYAALDGDIARQELSVQQSEAGYHRYLQHQQVAQSLADREQAYREQLQATSQAEQQLQALQQAFEQAKAIFHPEELEALRTEIGHLKHAQIQLIHEMKSHQEKLILLEEQITSAEALQLELEAAQTEKQVLDDLHKMTEQFRKLIKDAAPHVLKAMLADISAEANRIFGEVLGDHSAQLSWRNDYEIILRRQGVDRTFAQLSGGEQMSAALAVRLALLKKLSTLNLAFFDEPTQNMDELRRMNLAEQIRRVRGFDQLIVISHDDTFEQGLDSLVRLNKVHNETQVLDDEDGTLPQANFGPTFQNQERGHPMAATTN